VNGRYTVSVDMASRAEVAWAWRSDRCTAAPAAGWIGVAVAPSNTIVPSWANVDRLAVVRDSHASNRAWSTSWTGWTSTVPKVENTWSARAATGFPCRPRRMTAS
jgi:hypothetical protein